jgi:anti-sigma factor RsiW
MMSQGDRVPDWLLERLAAGELPASQAAELRGRLAARGEEHRLTALATSNQQILASLPADTVVAEVRRRAAASRVPARRGRPVFALSLATACAAGLAIFLVVRGQPGTTPPSAGQHDKVHEGRLPWTGIKGDPSLRIHRKTTSGEELLPRQASVHKGDTLQIGYIAAGWRYGVIASVDGRGTVTLHLPESPGPAAALEQSGEHSLPHSYELDDSPGFERFVFVAGDAPFATADVTSALRRGGALPAHRASYELTLKKAAP